MPSPHIYALGETILDIIFRDEQPMAARPGGSSFNTSVSLGRLKTPVTMISEMGKDRVGDIILGFMRDNGVNTDYISRYETGHSAIALAFLNRDSDAEYQFYKDYPFQRLDMDIPEFCRDDLLMYGSYYSLNPGIRSRVIKILECAREREVCMVYDPNFRDSHSDERNQLLEFIRENMLLSDLVRASDEDMYNIYGARDAEEAWKAVQRYCDLFIYTANARNVVLKTPELSLDLAVDQIEPVSTIGAGDTFNAGILYGIYINRYGRKDLKKLGPAEWEILLRRAIEFSKQVCLSYDNYLPVEIAETIIKTS